jgi:hypothetical protein
MIKSGNANSTSYNIRGPCIKINFEHKRQISDFQNIEVSEGEHALNGSTSVGALPYYKFIHAEFHSGGISSRCRSPIGLSYAYINIIVN